MSLLLSWGAREVQLAAAANDGRTAQQLCPHAAIRDLLEGLARPAASEREAQPGAMARIAPAACGGGAQGGAPGSPPARLAATEGPDKAATAEGPDKATTAGASVGIALRAHADSQGRPFRCGGCRCGAVRFELRCAEGGPLACMHCHCRHCQQHSGAASVAWATVRCAHLAITRGRDAIREYRSDVAVRSFCGDCGCPLSWRQLGQSEEVDVPLASLDPRVRPRATGSGSPPVILRLSSGYPPVLLRFSSGYPPLILRLSSGSPRAGRAWPRASARPPYRVRSYRYNLRSDTHSPDWIPSRLVAHYAPGAWRCGPALCGVGAGWA